MTRRRKPAGTSKQQGSGGAKVLQLVPDNDAPAPPAPAGLSTKAVARWDAFWKSKLKRKSQAGPAIVFARVERSEPVRRPAVVLLGDARIEVFADTDEEALNKAVRALRGSR